MSAELRKLAMDGVWLRKARFYSVIMTIAHFAGCGIL